jgi:signal transduction histidine kinase
VRGRVAGASQAVRIPRDLEEAMTKAAADRKAGRSPAELAAEMRNPLTAIWNAVHLMTLDRDGTAAGQVRDIVARQVALLSAIADELEETGR